MHKQRLENLGLSSCGSRSLWRGLVSGVSGVGRCALLGPWEGGPRHRASEDTENAVGVGKRGGGQRALLGRGAEREDPRAAGWESIPAGPVGRCRARRVRVGRARARPHVVQGSVSGVSG